MTKKNKEKNKKRMESSKGQGQSEKPFGLTRVRDTRMPSETNLMVTPTDPVVRQSPDSLTNRKRKLLSTQILKELQKTTKKKSTGGDLKSDSANQMSNRDIEVAKQILSGKADKSMSANQISDRDMQVAKRLLEAEKKNKKALGGKIHSE